MFNRTLSGELLQETISEILHSGFSWSFSQEKHRLEVENEAGRPILTLRLPINMKSPEDQAKQESFVILLIQSGSCAMGLGTGDALLSHKVFKSYMVRKKQGTSQLKYLNAKGKSKAGSRVRLSNTVDFFEDINSRLQEYFENNLIDKIALSCSKTLIPYFFASKVKTPFTKDDPRILKIPKHIHQPNHEVLVNTFHYLLKGELNYEDGAHPLVNKIIAWLLNKP